MADKDIVPVYGELYEQTKNLISLGGSSGKLEKRLDYFQIPKEEIDKTQQELDKSRKKDVLKSVEAHKEALANYKQTFSQLNWREKLFLYFSRNYSENKPTYQQIPSEETKLLEKLNGMQDLLVNGYQNVKKIPELMQSNKTRHCDLGERIVQLEADIKNRKIELAELPEQKRQVGMLIHHLDNFDDLNPDERQEVLDQFSSYNTLPDFNKSAVREIVTTELNQNLDQFDDTLEVKETELDTLGFELATVRGEQKLIEESFGQIKENILPTLAEMYRLKVYYDRCGRFIENYRVTDGLVEAQLEIPRLMFETETVMEDAKKVLEGRIKEVEALKEVYHDLFEQKFSQNVAQIECQSD